MKNKKTKVCTNIYKNRQRELNLDHKNFKNLGTNQTDTGKIRQLLVFGILKNQEVIHANKLKFL